MLTTRCPHCGTAFRVKPEQLRARGGRVRCGHCKAPFSALEGLIEDVPVAPDELEADARAAVPDPVSAPTPTPHTVSEPVSAPSVEPAPPAPARSPAPPLPAPLPPVAAGSVRPVFRRESPDPAGAPLAPPIPELEPDRYRAHRGSHVDLDFDLDSPDLGGAVAASPVEPESNAPLIVPESAPAPHSEPAEEPSRAHEATELTWEWRESSPPQPDVDLTESDWRGGRPGEPAHQEPPTEIALDSDHDGGLSPEPMFVTAFASPAGTSSQPIWPTGTPTDTEEAARLEDEAIRLAVQAGRDRRRAEDGRVEPQLGAAPDSELIREGEPEELDEADVLPPHWTGDEPQHRTWPWTLGVCVFGILGLAQGLLWARHDLAREFPEARPAFEAICGKLGCAMPWPRVPSYIGIEATDLHPPAAKDGAFELSGTLRNRAGFAQAYPYLEITLTDVYDRALVRRALTPDEWLPVAQRGTPAFPAGSDIAFTVHFDARDQQASGYKLYAFYP